MLRYGIAVYNTRGSSLNLEYMAGRVGTCDTCRLHEQDRGQHLLELNKLLAAIKKSTGQ